MQILSKLQANQVVDFYSEKMIGKPITDPEDTNPYLITSLEIRHLAEDEFAVYCIVRHYGNVLHKRIDKAIKELNLLPLDEFLSGLNQ